MRLYSFLFVILLCQLTNGQDLLKQTKVDSISVLFDYGSSVVKNKTQLMKQLNALDLGKNGRIELFGYTDTIASIASNRQLAFQRMVGVTEILRNSKLKTCLIDSVNRNEIHGKTTLTDAQFRRVDILVYKVEPTFSLNTPINLKINFEPGTDNILPESFPTLGKLKTLLDMDPSLVIQLNGHVCCDTDQPLSEKRAERVKSFLTMKGIAASRIACAGFSNTKPLEPEINEENKAINRRVEVVFNRK